MENNIIEQKIQSPLSDNIDDLFSHIQTFPKKLKIGRPFQLYDDGLQTAISNSEITKFYCGYQRKNFKKYVKSIPFPFDKLGDNAHRFNKLNEIAHMFEGYTEIRLQLVKHFCQHLMNVILYDIYFDIETRTYTYSSYVPMGYDIYEKVDEIKMPDVNNIKEVKLFGAWLTDNENPLNYIVFLSCTNSIINRIRNHR